MKQNPEETENLLKILVSTQDKMFRPTRLTEDTMYDALFTDAIVAFDQISKRIERIFVKIAIKEWTNNARAYSKK